MVILGVGLYLPYIAVHTTIFERLIAMTRDRGNIGFLMYVVDAIGYLGYVAILLGKDRWTVTDDFLSLFRSASLVIALVSIGSVLVAIVYFARVRQA